MLKNVFILGDSYSTFEGYVPEGYASYYRPDGPSYLRKKPELERNENDVFKVEETWWYNFVKENGNLLLNCSWSGTTICNTGYDGCDNSECSFVARFVKLAEEGYFKKNKIDTLLLFGGTNDNWSNAPLGEKVYSDWTKEDLYNVFPAFSYLIHLFKTHLPDTKVYFILNSDFKQEIIDFYKEVCEKNSVPVIELHDIDKREGHPTVKGMETIKNQVFDFIKSNRKGVKRMKIEKIGEIKHGRQDGAIFGGYLFSFNGKGVCTVYETKNLNKAEEPFSEFTLNDKIIPHSNSVSFGKEFFDEKDEFPLLYTNIYNNYAKEEEKHKGVCLVYRIKRKDKTFEATLVQMIEIGFTEDENLWKSEKGDVRPYGNFVVDREKDVLYTYTMHDESQTTRFFAFDLPEITEGEMCEKFNVRRVVLGKEDIIDRFDCPYHHYMQGGCCHNDKIYTVEGGTNSEENPPVIRIIDLKKKKEIFFEKFGAFIPNIEPEMIDFENETCFYSDYKGNVYKITL